MTITRFFVLVGFTNFDNRFFFIYDEAAPNIVDKAFATILTSTFEADPVSRIRSAAGSGLRDPGRKKW